MWNLKGNDTNELSYRKEKNSQTLKANSWFPGEGIVKNFGGRSCSVQLVSCVPLFVTHGLHHIRPPCSSPTPGVYSHSCPLSRWCHPTISSSVIPFSSCLQSFLASGPFQMSQFFTSGGQSICVSASASVLPMYIQDCFPLGWTGWISLQSKRLQHNYWKNHSFD